MDNSQYFALAKEWLMSKGLVAMTDFVIFLLLLLVGSQIIAAIARVTEAALERMPRVRPMLASFTLNVLRKTLWVVLLMVALPRIGIDIAPLVAGLGVMGFVVGFAFQESLSNLAAGVMILLNEPFVMGNYIQAGGHSGTVKELNMMATTMFTVDNRVITIPNRVIWGSSIINYSKNDTRRIDMNVRIGYASDLQKATAILHEILAADDRVLKDPKPVIELNEFGDSSMDLIVRPWVKRSDYGDVKFAFNRKLKEAFDREGIERATPQVQHLSS